MTNYYCQGPGNVTGLSLWYLPDNSIHSYGKVSTLINLSGNNFVFKQNTFSRQPLLVTDVLNGHSSLRFLKSSYTYMTFKGSPVIRTFFIVYRHTSFADWETPFTNDNTPRLFCGDNGFPKHVYHKDSTSVKSKNGMSFVNGQFENLLNYQRPTDYEIHSRVLTSNEQVNATYYLGSNTTLFSAMNGDILEIMAYNRLLTSAERIKIETYLATKYGITKLGNYVSSAGTVVMNYSTRSNHIKHIVGIGRDGNGGELDQRISKNKDDILIVSNGDYLNPSSFYSNMSYLYLGSNGDHRGYTSVGVPSGFSEISRRVWRVSKTGNGHSTNSIRLIGRSDILEIGNNPSEYRLLVDNDGDFSSGTTEYTGTLSGDTLSFTGLHLSDGNFVVLGILDTVVTTPSNDDSLSLWYLPDSSISSGGLVETLHDASGNGFDATQTTAGSRPSVVLNILNGHSVLRFDGANDYLLTDFSMNASVMPSITILTVYKPDVDDAEFVWGEDDGGWDRILGDFSVFSNLVGNGTDAESNIPNLFVPREYTMTTVVFNEDIINGSFVYVNSKLERTFTSNHGPETSANFTLGAIAPDGGLSFDGDVAEILVYNTVLSTIDISKIETYLSTKYGITKSGDYVNIAGAVVMDSSARVGYLEHIVGIGRDDSLGLSQVLSKNVNGILILSNANYNNVTTFSSDTSYVYLGSNGDSGYTSVGVPSGFSEISRRVWRVSKTGNGHSTNSIRLIGRSDILEIGNNPSEYRLLVDNDGDFSSGATEYVGTLSGDTLSFTGLHLSDGDFVVLGILDTVVTTPSNDDSLSLWYLPDSSISSGGLVETLHDVSGNGFDATQTAAGSRPSVVLNILNGHSVLRFDGANDYLLTDFSMNASVMPSITILTVYKPDVDDAEFVWGEDDGGWDRILGDFSVFSNLVGNGTDAESNIPNLFVPREYTMTTVVFNEDIINGSFVYVNSKLERTFTSNHGPETSANFTLGAIAPDGGLSFDGDVAEILVYNTVLSTIDISKIETYLSTKYGITKSGDYVNIAGAVVMDSSARVGYLEHIVGIGRDDSLGLSQVLSKNVNGILILSNANYNNVTTFSSDTSYVYLGSNGDSGYTSVGVPSGFSEISRRVWRVSKTGNGHSTNSIRLIGRSDILEIGNNPSEYRLLVDNDGDFSSGATEYTGTLSGDTLSFTGLHLSDGDFVALTRNIITIALNPKQAVLEETDSVYIGLHLSDTLSSDMAVIYRYNDINTTNEDYIGGLDTLVISAGSLEDSILVRLIDDAIFENLESFEIELVGIIYTGDKVLKILDIVDTISITDENDNINFIDVKYTTQNVIEGNNIDVVFELANAPLSEVLLYYSIFDENSSAGLDYNTSGGILTIPSGVSSGILTFLTLDDNLVEQTETTIIKIDSLVTSIGTILLGSNRIDTIQIIDEDTVVVSFVSSKDSIGEGDTKDVYIQLTGATLATPLIVSYTVNNIEASNNDYSLVSGALTISSGHVRDTLSVITVEDSIKEINERFVIQLSNVSLSGSMLSMLLRDTIIILDDDKFSRGLSSLNLWYLPDSSISSDALVSTVLDLSDYNFDASQTTIFKRPSFVPNALNGYSVLHFDGIDDHLRTNLSINSSMNPNITIVTVYKPNVDNAGFVWGEDDGGWDRGLGDFSVQSNMVGNGYNAESDIPNLFNIGEFTMTTVVFSEDVPNGSFVYVNGVLERTFTSNHGPETSADFTLGAIAPDGGISFYGDIAELMIYNEALEKLEIQKIETYLATKYGITKSEDYVNTNGSIVMNSDARLGYLKNIVGIGRDDRLGLDQRISRNTNGILTISNGNYNMVSDFHLDTSYLYLGSNGRNGYTELGIPNGFDSISNRVWRVSKSGYGHSKTNLSFIKNTSALPNYNTLNYKLLVDSDGDFTNGSTTYKGIVLSDTLLFSHISIQDGDYIAVAMKMSNYQLYSFSIVSCNSYQRNGKIYTETGLYTDTVYDSILTLNITIKSNVSHVDTVIACNSYTWRQQVYMSSGLYGDTVFNAHACDSIFLLVLTMVDEIDTSVSRNNEVVFTAQLEGGVYQWLDCIDNYTEIVGAVDRVYTAITDGSYAVEVEKNNCLDTSMCYTVTSLSVGENILRTFNNALVYVYPTLTEGYIYIDFGQPYEEEIFIVVRDIFGKVMSKKSIKKITIVNMFLEGNVGVYFVEISDKFGNKETFRIVKQ